MSSTGYSVIVSRSAQKEIRSLEQVIKVRVLRGLRALGAEPRPAGCLKLTGAQNRWRIRVGDYRVIYAIHDTSRVVEIITVRHRSKAYE